MKDKHPGMWVGMTRLVGNRSLVYNRNAMVMFYMMPYYLEYIEYRIKQVHLYFSLNQAHVILTRDSRACTQVGEFNQLHLRSVSKLCCMEIHAGLKARAVVMVHLLHPMLVMIKDTSCGYKFLDQEPYVQRLDQLVDTLQNHPERFLERDYVAFPGEQFRAVRLQHQRWRETETNVKLIDALFSAQTGASYAVMENEEEADSESDNEDTDDPQTLDDMVATFLRAYGVKLHERLRKGNLCVCTCECVSPSTLLIRHLYRYVGRFSARRKIHYSDR